MKIFKYFLAVTLLIPALFMGGCDSINKLPINVPISFSFQMSGSTLADSKTFCMSESGTYLDYQGEIKKLSILRVIYRTDSGVNSVQPEQIQGIFQLIISRGDNGQELINRQVNLKPIDHKKPNPPYELSLTVEEVAIVNQYLNSNINGDPCFVGSVTLFNISGGSPPYQLNGHVDVLIEAEVEF